MDINTFLASAAIATCISVIVSWLSTKANNERKKKESTIQYANTHAANTEELLVKINGKKLNGMIDIKKVLADKKLTWIVEKYLFAMERLSVGINTRVLDIHVFDRIMGQKTIEHYDVLYPYIKYIRKKDYSAKYTEFEILVDKLRIIRDKRFPKHKRYTKGRLGNFFD